MTSSFTLERKHKCDPRVGIVSRILHMDPATLAGPGGPIGGRATPIWWIHMLIFSSFVTSCIHMLKVQVELVIGKNMFMSCYSSFETEAVDCVECVNL